MLYSPQVICCSFKSRCVIHNLLLQLISKELKAQPHATRKNYILPLQMQHDINSTNSSSQQL